LCFGQAACCVCLQTTDYTNELFIWKETKEFGLCTAHDPAKGMTINFPSFAGKSAYFTQSFLPPIDTKILRVAADPGKYYQVTVVRADTGSRDAEIVDITNASINNAVKVQYLDDTQQEDVDLTNLR
jgi:hypothetical protein